MKYVLINNSIEKIYNSANEESELIDEILYGMYARIIEDTDKKFVYISTEYGYEGYIKKDKLILDSIKTTRWIKIRNTIIINNFADILEEPRIQSKILQCLPKGSFVYSTGNVKENLWSEVELVNGKIGWIKSAFLRNTNSYKNLEEAELRNNLVKDALSYLGTQYRWGGKTTQGIDCSGLCSMVYMLNGIIIYRDAKIKPNFPIKKIDVSSLKKGDLLFFPGHVAMYIDNSKYIHSSNTNNIVKINSLNENDVDYREDLAKSLLYCGSIFTNR